MTAHDIRAILLASATVATLVGRLARSFTSQGRRVPWRCAYLTTAKAPTTFLAPAGVLFGHEANPGGKVAAGPEALWIGDCRHQGAG